MKVGTEILEMAEMAMEVLLKIWLLNKILKEMRELSIYI